MCLIDIPKAQGLITLRSDPYYTMQSMGGMNLQFIDPCNLIQSLSLVTATTHQKRLIEPVAQRLHFGLFQSKVEKHSKSAVQLEYKKHRRKLNQNSLKIPIAICQKTKINLNNGTGLFEIAYNLSSA